jgi:hypothetical protein
MKTTRRKRLARLRDRKLFGYRLWDGGGDGGGGAGAAGGGGGAGGNTNPAPLGRTFTQDDVKRLLEKAAAETEGRIRGDFQQQLADLEAAKEGEFDNKFRSLADSFKTKEQLAAQEIAKHKEALASAQKEGKEAVRKYKQSVINRALKDACIAKAAGTDPAITADIIAGMLREKAELGDNEAVYVEMEVTEAGVTAKKKLTPAEAVAIIEANPVYGTLFKTSATGGVSGKQDATGANKPKGPMDIKGMSQAEFNKLRKADPVAFYKALHGET